MRVHPQGCATLTLSETSPDAELHAVIQCVGTTIKQNRAIFADLRGFPLGGTLNKEGVGVALTAASLCNPLPTFRIELTGLSYEAGASAPTTDK